MRRPAPADVPRTAGPPCGEAAGRQEEAARTRGGCGGRTGRRMGARLVALLAGVAHLACASAARSAEAGNRRTPAPHTARVSALLGSLLSDLSLPRTEQGCASAPPRVGRRLPRKVRVGKSADDVPDAPAHAAARSGLPSPRKGSTAIRLSETLDEVLQDLGLARGSLASGMQTSPLHADMAPVLKMPELHVAGGERARGVGAHHASLPSKARRSATARRETGGGIMKSHRLQESDRVRSVPEAAGLQTRGLSVGQTRTQRPGVCDVGSAPRTWSREGGAIPGLAGPGYGVPREKPLVFDDPLDIVHHQVCALAASARPISSLPVRARVFAHGCVCDPGSRR